MSIDKIELYMTNNEHDFIYPTNMGVFAYCTFIFPSGKTVRVDSHDLAAETVGKELNMDIKRSIDLERLGIIRVGKASDIFYIYSHEIPTKQAEETIIDQIVKKRPTSIAIELGQPGSQADAFRKRLDRQFDAKVT